MTVKLELLNNDASQADIVDHINRITKEIEYNLNNVVINAKHCRGFEIKLTEVSSSVYELNIYKNGNLVGSVSLT